MVPPNINAPNTQNNTVAQNTSLLVVNEEHIVYIHTMKNFSKLKKEGNPITCNNMDLPWYIVLS